MQGRGDYVTIAYSGILVSTPAAVDLCNVGYRPSRRIFLRDDGLTTALPLASAPAAFRKGS